MPLPVTTDDRSSRPGATVALTALALGATLAMWWVRSLARQREDDHRTRVRLGRAGRGVPNADDIIVG